MVICIILIHFVIEISFRGEFCIKVQCFKFSFLPKIAVTSVPIKQITWRNGSIKKFYKNKAIKMKKIIKKKKY